jgi:Protein of unknown function (DUF4197)
LEAPRSSKRAWIEGGLKPKAARNWRKLMIATNRRRLTIILGALLIAASIQGRARAQTDTVAGLKEALTKSAESAVSLTGRPGGYSGNPAIKILLPKSMATLEKGLRAVGYGPQLDKLVASMNRAAEAAAPKARPIFEKAITDMSFTDAKKIVTGGGQSATNYFKRKTSGQLTEAFTPVVEGEMKQYDVSNQFEGLVSKYTSTMSMGGALGGLMGKAPSLDINRYVVAKSLDGLFYMMGKEERKIRTDPAAQVTPLLKSLFGGEH